MYWDKYDPHGRQWTLAWHRMILEKLSQHSDSKIVLSTVKLNEACHERFSKVDGILVEAKMAFWSITHAPFPVSTSSSSMHFKKQVVVGSNSPSNLNHVGKSHILLKSSEMKYLTV